MTAELYQDAYALAWLLGVAACVAVICTVAVLFTRMIRHWLALMRQETQRQIEENEFLGRVMRQSRENEALEATAAGIAAAHERHTLQCQILAHAVCDPAASRAR